MQAWLVNGRESTAIGLDDRGLAYGDGLFETVAVRNGEPRFLGRHLSRLATGCQRLAIPVPDQQQIEEQITRLTAGHGSGTVKIILTRGTGPRGYAPPAEPRPTLAVGFATDQEPHPSGSFAAGWVVISSSVPMSANRHLAGLKTLNRLDSVLGRAECIARRADEGIMRGPDRDVIGGTMSNLFLVCKGRLVTPALEQAGIRGIMRGIVIELAGMMRIPVSECRIEPDDLRIAEEIFLTNSLVGVRPVCQLDGKQFSIGPMTRALGAGLLRLGVEECAQ